MDARPAACGFLQETYPKLQDAPAGRRSLEHLPDLWPTNLGPKQACPPPAPRSPAFTRGTCTSKGRPINDSFHFGQTLINDNGRPYQEGFNALDGFSARAEGYHLSHRTCAGSINTHPAEAPYPLNQCSKLIAHRGQHTPLLAPEPVAQTNVFRLIDANLGLGGRSPRDLGRQGRGLVGSNAKPAAWRSAITPNPCMLCASIAATPLRIPVRFKRPRTGSL